MSHAATTPAAAAPPRLALRGPGLGWLPAVWRRGATWRTVGRFVLWGPLIGGAPYAVFVVTIPLVYLVGFIPAALAGWLFATWLHAGRGRSPSWPWLAMMGALCGGAAAGIVALASVVIGAGASARPDWVWPLIAAVHGVPAAVVVALLEPAPREDPRR